MKEPKTFIPGWTESLEYLSIVSLCARCDRGLFFHLPSLPCGSDDAQWEVAAAVVTEIHAGKKVPTPHKSDCGICGLSLTITKDASSYACPTKQKRDKMTTFKEIVNPHNIPDFEYTKPDRISAKKFVKKYPIREFNKYLFHQGGGGYLDCILIGEIESKRFRIRRARTQKGQLQFWGGSDGKWLKIDLNKEWYFQDWTRQYGYGNRSL